MKTPARLLTLSLLFAVSNALALEYNLNLYSSRHYQTDEALYANFTKATGIRLNRIEAGEDPLIERIRNEGAASPADVLVTADAGRLWRAEQLGLFQAIDSKVLASRLPDNMRNPNNLWFGFSARARVLVYNKSLLKAGDVLNYEDLAEPRFKGKVCSRSGGHIYNLSLMGALVEHWGEARAEAWARGVVANLARPPRGGDTDQIKAVAAGECAVALSNTYYYVRLMRSDNADDRKAVEATALVFPNQKSFGTHMNVSGAGVVKTAKNREAAIRYLEYLASDAAQNHFAEGNNEWPVARGVPMSNKALAALGSFRADNLNISVLGRNQPLAQKIFDRVGFR
jgi:iron(III) transport system substrate-binding protein